MRNLSDIGVRSCRGLHPSKHLDHGLLFFIDLDCKDAGEILKQAVSRSLFGRPFRWLMMTRSTEVEARRLLNELPILADSDLVLALQTDERFRMIELHKPAPDALLESSERGSYSGELRDVRPHRSLYMRRRNLLLHPLTMALVVQDSNSSILHLEDRLEPQYDYLTKTSWCIIRLAMEMLNATPSRIWSNSFGYYRDGKWTGMIENMRTARADVGINCLMTDDRMREVSFTDNVAPFRVCFIYRQPPLSYVANIFKLPFSSGVWVSLVVCTLASSIVLWAATYWEAKSRNSSSQLDGSISDALLLSMGALSQQGSAVEPIKASGRIMTIVLLMSMMALYAAYSANIVVLLQAPSSSIRNLKQLGSSAITLAANDLDYNHHVLELYSRRDPLRLKIYKRIEADKGKKQYYHLNEGVERIRQGLFAFHSLVEPVYRRIENTFHEHEKCDLMEVDYLGQGFGYTPVTKNSSYLELFRVAFKQIQESGIKNVMIRRLITPKPKCAQKAAMFSSVGLRDLMPVIVLMSYGMATAVAIAILEIIVHRLIKGHGNITI